MTKQREFNFRISYINVSAIFFIFFCLNLSFFVYKINLSSIIDYIQLIGLFIYLFLFIIHKKHRHSLMTFFVISLYAIMLISTILNKGNWNFAIKSMTFSLTICLIFEYGLTQKGEPFLRAVGNLLILLVVLDLLTEFLYPEGMYSTFLYKENWLLGYKTAHVNVSIPALTITAMNSVTQYGKMNFRTYLFAFIAILDSALAKATGGTIALILITTVLILIDLQQTKSAKKILMKFFNYKMILIVIAVLYILLVFVQNIQIFYALITGILHKSITLSQRTTIWTVCLELINDKLFLGNGLISSDRYVRLTGIAGGTQPHNFILGILVSSGILGLGIFIYIMYLTFRKVEKEFFNAQYICGIAILVNLFLGLSTYNVFAPFTFALYILAYHLKYNELFRTKSKYENFVK